MKNLKEYSAYKKLMKTAKKLFNIAAIIFFILGFFFGVGVTNTNYKAVAFIIPVISILLIWLINFRINKDIDKEIE